MMLEWLLLGQHLRAVLPELRRSTWLGIWTLCGTIAPACSAQRTGDATSLERVMETWLRSCITLKWPRHGFRAHSMATKPHT